MERRDIIAGRLAQGQSVTAGSLAEEFSVSPDAIRRDLRALAAEGRCRRVYGGALPISPASSPIIGRVGEARERKAALAAAAVGLIRPGEFVFLDQPVHRLGKKERLELQKRNIGFVFQSYHLLDDLTVYENLEVPLSYRDVKRSERQAIVADVLDRFHIVGKKDLYPSQLSGGQQQLVAVARAVVASPKVILADEPTGNLHTDQGREIMELFKKLNGEGTTIIQVTHSEVNAGYGDRVIKLRDGWIVE